MKNADLVVAPNTIWVARNGGTGSPVGPLLHHKPTPAALWLPPAMWVKMSSWIAAFKAADR